MIRALVAVLMLWMTMLALPAQAQTAWLHVYGTSWHQEPGYNSRNWGLGAEVQLADRWTVAGGTYRNSVDRDSWYALAKRQVWQQGSVIVNLNMGAATGYQSSITPVVLPEVCWAWLCGFVLPRAGAGTTAMTALYLRIPLWQD